MRISEIVKKELKELLENEKVLIELTQDHNDFLEFGAAYQHWYSRAYKLVESLSPERLKEFTSYYLIDPKRNIINEDNYVIQDYIKGTDAKRNFNGHQMWNTNAVAMIRVMNQMQLIASLSSRIDSVLQDVTGHLFSELQDSELGAAVQLKRINRRAAGALAGVVLERHLQRVAENHKISIRKKYPTISDLNDPLKQAGVYDIPNWRKIQMLADIRNLCSHQKSVEPTDKQVDDLISGVDSLIKTVF